MSVASQSPVPGGASAVEHVDVLIVGAGLSGIGAACHLQRRLPHKRWVILEARGASGGTWDLFRYPGVRSDSDMFTLGYAFRPWRDSQAITTGGDILRYLRDTAREYGVAERIRYHRRVVATAWDSGQARWTVEVQHTGTGATERLTCDFLYACTGYYRYDEGYTPAFPGMERFTGLIVHPQHWPDDLDHRGRRVVVIGSGATAVTLVPALAPDAAHVTLLQRSPSYIVSLPARDVVAERLLRLLPPRRAAALVRGKNVLLGTLFYHWTRRAPERARRRLRQWVARQLPDGFDVATHFTPRYDPWDQRLCLSPDGDLFTALRAGSVSLVTDTITEFTEQGLRLGSGATLEADIVVTATGLNLLAMGGIAISVDGRSIEPVDMVTYKGVMVGGVPNFAFALGYVNASWTLKADLTAAYVCRLLQHMEAHGHRVCIPEAPGPSEPTEPLLPLTSGYIRRSLAVMPRQGSRAPWKLHQSYLRDLAMLTRGRVDDHLRFAPAPASRPRRVA